MAAANLVVKMLLDSNGFDKNIKTAKASIEGFEKIGKNVLGTLGKFAGAIGLATTASAAFEKVIRGSQATSDAFDRVMRVGKTSVDAFFTSISTGDFSAFNQGLNTMIEKAKDAATALDQLGNTTMSFGYFSTKYGAEFQEAMAKVRDKTLSPKEIEEAMKVAEAAIEKQREITTSHNQTVDEAMRSLVTETNGLSKDDVNRIDVEEIFYLDVSAHKDELKSKLDAEYKEYQKIYDEVRNKHTKRDIVGTSIVGGAMTAESVDYAAVKEEMKVYNQRYRAAVLYNEILKEWGDNGLQYLMNIMSQSDNATRNLASMEKTYVRVKNMELSNGKTTKEDDIPAVEGSLRYINEEIAKVQKELQNLNPELNPQKVAELQNKLAELENQKRKIEFEVTYIEKGAKQDSVALGKQGLLIDPLTMPEPKIKSTDNTTKVITEGKKASDQWAESLTHVSNILGSVTNMTNEGAGAWLAWGGNILSSVAAAIPMLATLFAAETAVAGATAARSAAETPIVGWLLAGAAVASVLAAVATLPKFANGGIVDSPFTSGDRVLARVNGGEMILNKTQQSNLFNLLDNGVGAGTNKTVQFEIEGKKLVGVLKNYNNKINKAL